MNDLDAVRETLNGNSDAFSVIVKRYTPVIYRLAYRMSESNDPAAEAEESVQEIFLNAYSHLNTFNIRYKFYSWLYTIALNYLRSLRRKNKFAGIFSFVSYDDAVHSSEGESLFSFSGSPEEISINMEAEQFVMKALKMLKTGEREVFILRQIENMTVDETAEILRIPHGTVKNRLHRARKELSAIMKKWHWDDREII